LKYAQADKEFLTKGKGIGFYNCYCEKYSVDLEILDNYYQFCGEYL
jgi:hypothetical protein